MMGGNIFTYDSENHMTSMTQGSTVVTMKYDAFGNRASKTAGARVPGRESEHHH